MGDVPGHPEAAGGTTVPSNGVPRTAKPEVHASSPGLGWYTDHVLFHQVWNRPGLGKRDRSLVVVSALVTLGHTAQLSGHLKRALDNGVRPLEIVEVITHLAFFAGWPCAMSALAVMRQVFSENAIDPLTLGQSVGVNRQSVAGRDRHGDATRSAGAVRAAIADTSDSIVLDELWGRPELSSRDRSLVTISSLVASGGMAEFEAFLRRGMSDGLRISEIAEAIAHLAFYAGRGRAVAAARVVDAAVDRKGESRDARDDS
jgi:4-carboxymuconolactone decarboxylase